jgi:15-cis-phytoene synthase
MANGEGLEIGIFPPGMDEPLAPSPSLLDPRVMLMVPRGERAALTSLWNLEARLFGVVAHRREVVLAQIKLAWWRERLAQVADDPQALPKGEPLLAELTAAWHGRAPLVPVADAYEAIMLAEDGDALALAGMALAAAMQAGPAWGLARAALLAGDEALQSEIWERVAVSSLSTAPRHVRTLDRWAQLLARQDGAASARAEGWLLLRAGIGF